MLRFLAKHRQTIVGFFVLILPLVSLWYHGLEHKEATVYQRTVMRMTSPAQNVMSDVIGAVVLVWTDYVWLVGVQEQNRVLRRQNEELRGVYQDRNQLRQENHRLKSLLSFKGERPDLETVTARVVAKDVSPYHRVLKIKISAGAKHGVRRYQHVITQAGVVGHIDKLAGEYAEVKLAVDSGARISVDVSDRDMKGTVLGAGDKNTYVASFITLTNERQVQPRDLLVTNGEDERFPKGLVVGYVDKALPRHEDGGHRYSVIPSVPFATLAEVLVVTSQIEQIPTLEDTQ